VEELAFGGQVFHPVAPSFLGPIYFELVKDGSSTTMMFDPGARQATPAASPPATTEGSVISPDGKWTAFESMQGGGKQVWLRETGSGKTEVAVGGDCNNSSPAWENSHSLIFASDCGRGLGMPVLYRANIPQDINSY
jgi:Tol biopolymer transport system component